MIISQKNAVIDTVKNILKSDYDPSKPVKDILTKEQVGEIKDAILNGILKGEIAYNKDVNQANVIKKYVSGMVSNHFRKAKELNGGTKYSILKTRTPRDVELGTLKLKLSSCNTSSDEFTKIAKQIDERECILKSVKKNNKYDIDVTILSDDLKAVVVDSL